MGGYDATQVENYFNMLTASMEQSAPVADGVPEKPAAVVEEAREGRGAEKEVEPEPGTAETEGKPLERRVSSSLSTNAPASTDFSEPLRSQDSACTKKSSSGLIDAASAELAKKEGADDTESTSEKSSKCDSN